MTEKIKKAMDGNVVDQIVKIVVVLVIPWSIWVTQSIYASVAFQQRGDRFSAQDGHRLEKVILEESNKLRTQINNYEKEFSRDFVRHSELEKVIEGLRK